MPAKRILVFDLDGTLIDTMSDLADLFCEMLQAEHGVPDEVSRPVYVELAGMGPRPQFEAVLATEGITDAEMIDDITERYWKRAEQFEPRIFLETLEVLEMLAQGGHTLIVSSGGTIASVERKMRLTGIDRLFRLALGTDDDVPGMRKGPGHFAAIRGALGLGNGDLAAHGVFVGDAVFDMQVAREAGLVAVGRVSDENGAKLIQAGAEYLIRDLRELPPLLAAR